MIQHITVRLEHRERRAGDDFTRAARKARMQRAIDQRQRLERLVEEGRRMLGSGGS